ncbi:MAG: hydantoinase/oxoprolinase family protein, partial [Gaiellaceae bacterium]
ADTTYVVAVDAGGTFTDCVAVASDGMLARGKAASTPADPSVGVLAAVERVADVLALTVEELFERAMLFAHGTTVATNALLTRSGSRTGLLTTRGHEDAIIIGRTYQKVAGLNEAELQDVANLDKATPIVPRKLIHGVQERIDARGELISPLNLDSARRALDMLVAEGADAVAVSFLWAFVNPTHERAVGELVAREYPDLVFSVSHEIAPVIKEYERTATTAVNSYLVRTTAGYLDALERRLRESRFDSMPVVMQSSGGVRSLASAKTRPVSLLTSGPAGGVIGAKVLGGLIGEQNLITTDVGGTSFDVGLVVDGEPQYSDASVFEQYELVVPIIDIATIGAGGGSIAWIEPETGVLRVGPQSAGADPGPACYGLGGREPTVTDANVVLGRINPQYFLGGRHPLNAALAGEAIARVGGALDLGVEEAAMGIVDIADAHMADLVRKVTVERGFDPRDFVLLAFGGAGPAHAAAFGPAAGCGNIVVPLLASEFSAFGIAGSDAMVVEEYSDPMFAPFDPERLRSIFEGLSARALAQLRENGIADERTYVNRYVRLRYRGQVHEVETPVPAGPIEEDAVGEILRSFEQLYEMKYGHGTTYAHAGLQAITFSVHAFGRLYPPKLATYAANGRSPEGARKPDRPVYFRGEGFVQTQIYDADRLGPGQRLLGPAIVEAIDTTLVVHPGQEAEVDPYLNLVISTSG